eukprot:TRINITY_DN20765_c0_g1_i1.p1 TRINITY_DN20765_c0_g1~~TRINITY_DN20765_c0_g1_i1.p1  ORF type:complete len:576 (-),score=118.19 TRINITY_DN20765_c0_g1_i1:897-2624(-)
MACSEPSSSPIPAQNGGVSHPLQQKYRSPTNPLVTPLLTDFYQITMAYAYWKAGKQDDAAVFDLFYRKNPFGGEFAVFAGLEECIRFVASFHFEEDELDYLRGLLPMCEEAFFVYLRQLDCSAVRIYAIPEGSVVFPTVPLIRVEGPLLVAQMLETTFLTLVNFASLVTTNAARHRQVAGPKKYLMEFGLRRAQGPDGGMSASRYCYMGGFDATSNAKAGMLFGIPLKGTHSHAYVTSYKCFEDIQNPTLAYADGKEQCQNFVTAVKAKLTAMQGKKSLRAVFSETNTSELAAFTAYALAFPTTFQALVDTYDVLRSGIPNFCAVSLALWDLGYKPVGVRLDSGDLAYLSVRARDFLALVGTEFGIPEFKSFIITASNDINEETLDSLNKQGHEIDAFGIGTHLVTCYRQPALGCVYKLVDINGHPAMKLSEEVEKVTIPGRKQCYRLYGREGLPLVDLMQREDDPPPQAGQRILCRHPFSEAKRAHVVPARVESLYKCFWAGGRSGGAGGANEVVEALPSLVQLKERCQEQLVAMRPDHLRRLNPTPYKVSVSDRLYIFFHTLWLNEAPVGELV